eukprot:6196313-Pleurochrysis_carterae.AAC.1
MAHDVSGSDGPQLRCRSHVLVDSNYRTAFVVSNAADGVFTVGSFADVLHANLASTWGERLVVTCCSNLLH